MTVAACPSCHENVTVPIDALPDSTVRCPLCREEFQLQEFLTQLPPSLILLDQTATDDSRTHAAANTRSTESEPRSDSGPIFDGIRVSAFSEQGGSDSRTQPVDATDSATIPEFELDTGPDERSESASAAVPVRRARRQKSPGWEITKVVAGGLLALPLAQLILWWLPGNWQRDPLQIGPSVGRVLPWVVPANYRPVRAARSQEPERRRRMASTFGKKKPTRDRPSVDQSSRLPLPGQGRQATDPKNGKGPGATTVPTGQPAAGSATASPKPATGEAGQTTAKVAISGSDAESPPSFSVDDLRTALESALQASVAWDTAVSEKDEDQVRRTENLYESFAALGNVITYMKPGDPEALPWIRSLQHVLSSFGQQPDKLAMIGNRSQVWLDDVNRSNNGVLLFGTVKRIETHGAIHESVIELASRKKRAVSVVSRVDPRPFYKVNDRILMLGAVINRPSQILPASAPTHSTNSAADQATIGKPVVLGGFPVPVKS